MDVLPPIAELVGPLAGTAGASMPVQAQAYMPIVLPEVHIAPKDKKAHYSLPNFESIQSFVTICIIISGIQGLVNQWHST